jgi:DNA-directed RNA polymerase specialized sigma24 family protein
MNNIEDVKKEAADLHWLAFLLTGDRQISIDIAIEALAAPDDTSPFFTGWMQGWSRRIVIAKALAAVRKELAESARRIESARWDRSGTAPRTWSLDPRATRARLEEALLAIDVFPRAALVLTIFEGVRIADAAVLLDVSVELLRKAQAIGLRELTGHLARKQPAASRHLGAFRLALATE